MGEPVIEGFIEGGRASEPGWYLRLRLLGLAEGQARRIREQALEVLDRYDGSERATILGTFRSIVQAIDDRLARPGAPNAVLIHITPDETDPWSQVRDDRGTAVAFALRFADDADPVVAEVWREVAETLDELRFTNITKWTWTIGTKRPSA